MRFRIALIICFKELAETVRDKRTLLMAIGIPVVFYPLMLIGVTKLTEARKEATEAQRSRVAVWGTLPAGLEAELKRRKVTLTPPWEGIPPEIRQALERGVLLPPTGDPEAEIPEEPEPAGKGSVKASPEATQDTARDTAREAAQDAPNPAPPPTRPAQPGDPPPKTEEIPPETPLTMASRPFLESKGADAILVLWPGHLEAEAAFDSWPVSIYYDSVRTASQQANARVTRAIQTFRKKSLKARLAREGLPETFARPLTLHATNVAQPRRQLGDTLGGLLPLFLVMLSTLGTIYPSIDMTAGEKERGTMQTLLCAPVRPLEILLGKLMAVWTVATVTAVVNLGSLAAVAGRILGKNLPADLNWSTYLMVFGMILPLVIILSVVYFAVCVFARDFKDAQNLITPVYMVLSFLPAVAAVPGIELTRALAFIPVVNISLLIKAVMVGSVATELAFLTVISSLIFATLAVLFAARVFNNELVVLGGRESFRSIFGLHGRAGGLPSPSFAIVFIAVLMVFQFYGSILLVGRSILVMLLGLQLGMMLLPVLGVVLGFRFSIRDTLHLHSLSWRGALGAVLLGVSAWGVATGIFTRLLPAPPELAEGLKELLMMGDEAGSLPLALLLFAVIPAISEELCFRGLALSGMRRLGMWPALLGTALLFGIVHASIYRLLPTAFLGLLMGYAVWKSGSILAGMVVHVLNNGLIVVLVHLSSELEETDILPWSYTLVALGVMAAGIWLLRGLPPEGSLDRPDAGRLEALPNVGDPTSEGAVG